MTTEPATLLGIDPVREAARSSLLAYILCHSSSYEVAPHHRMLAASLERVASGECRRLMIFMPPRHGKSLAASGYFPAWFLGKHPNKQIIAATYSQDLADTFGRSVRDTLMGPIHSWVFPESQTRRGSTAVSYIQTTRGGIYASAGVDGSITGKGAHLLSIDDPLKGAAEADSQAHQRRFRQWYSQTARTRLMKDGSIVMTTTRWRADDPAGWVLSQYAHEGWEIVCLPAMAEDDDPLGRPVGAPLWPEHFPLSELNSIKMGMTPFEWAALYQQRPVPESGGLFQREWLQFYGGTESNGVPIAGAHPLPEKFEEVVDSWDCAFKGLSTSDYVVGQKWGRVGANYYLLAQIRARMDFTATVASVEQLAAMRPTPREVLIEDKANGPAVITTLRRRVPRIIEIEPDGGKVARATAVSPLFQARNVWLPHPSIAPWIGDYCTELAVFPRGKHDDQTDATTQALARMNLKSRPARGVVSEGFGRLISV